MAFTPESPFPKSRGHVIKSKDWNDAVTEVQRLDTAKVNKSGDNVTGSLTIAGNLGVGTTGPQAKLHVSSAEPQLRFDGTGNRTTVQVGKGGALQWDFGVGTGAAGNNDFWFGDFSGYRLVLQKGTGNVGVGATAPADRLDVAGNLRILTGSNPIRFTSGWSGFPDPVNNQAEISNDTGDYKTLMIIGNKSAGLGRRVSVWDRLEVNGTLIGTGNVGIGTASPQYALHIKTGWGFLGLDTTSVNQHCGVRFHENGVVRWHIWNDGSASGNGLTMHSNTTPALRLEQNGDVRLGTGNGQVYIGGNRTGPFMRLNDDLWFSDPQNGAIWIRNHNDSGWGLMVGDFNDVSSIRYKKDVNVLGETDLTHLLDDALSTDLVYYRRKEDEGTSRSRLGVITEHCPEYLVGKDGESLSTTEYIAMLHGALKALAGRVAVLEKK